MVLSRPPCLSSTSAATRHTHTHKVLQMALTSDSQTRCDRSKGGTKKINKKIGSSAFALRPPKMFPFSLHSLIKLRICHGSFSLCVCCAVSADERRNKELDGSADIPGLCGHMWGRGFALSSDSAVSRLASILHQNALLHTLDTSGAD